MNKTKKKNTLLDKLTFKYRFVVINEDSFEERFSFKLNRLSVFVIGGLFSIFLISLTILIIKYTPLKEYIQGYSSTEIKKKTTGMLYKIDSLEQIISVNSLYIQNIQKVFKGEVKPMKFDKDSIIAQLRLEDVDLNPSPVDSAFRELVEREDKFSVFEQATKKTDIVFSSPTKGTISQRYNLKENHFAVDIAVEEGTPVKAVANGTVIFTGFTAGTGYVIIIEHINGIISVYKHNESLYKKQGDLVKSGEVIATAGSTGEYSTGTHLHFELWEGGYAVDPTNYIDFE
ncbi:MAG: M23 family peptidase [Flavobacteriia bacterium]|nr:MAG: M23 family peptidase [Flavobacteriia bacterium]